MKFKIADTKKLNEFNQHDCIFKNRMGALGGRISYCFTPTKAGIVIRASCACGKDIDLSEYDKWQNVNIDEK